MPCWRPGIGSSSPWPRRTSPPNRTPVAAPHGPSRPRPGRYSRSWRPACVPWCKTAAAGPSPPSVSRRPVPPTRCRSSWPTAWPATKRDRGALELTGGGTRLRCLAPAMSLSSAPHRTSGSTAPRTPAGQLLPLGAGPGARRRPPARRLPQLPVGGRWHPRSAMVRQFRDGRPDRARRRPAGGGRRGARGSVVASARGPPGRGCGATDVDASSSVELRVLPGPHAEHFDAAALAGWPRRCSWPSPSPTGSGSGCVPRPAVWRCGRVRRGDGSIPRGS